MPHRHPAPDAASHPPASRVPPSPRERGEGRGEGLARQICVGIVTGPHGVRGAVRIKSFTERPEDVAAYGPLGDESGKKSFDLQLIGAAKGVMIGRFAGVDDRNRAEALRGQHLYLPRAALPPPQDDEYYHADLIGLAAVLADGTELGRVRAIHDFGAGDTLEIERNSAAPVMVPFTRAAVPVVEIEAGRLVIDPPPGLLDDSEGVPSTLGDGR
jgi:16S rRNA processing protein RimM